jgi:hypothetical protein
LVKNQNGRELGVCAKRLTAKVLRHFLQRPCEYIGVEMASKVLLDISSDRARSLKRYNLIAGAFHAIQAIAIIALSNGFSLPVHINYLQGPPVPDTTFEQVPLFSFPMGLGVASFSILSAIAHFYVSGPGFNKYIEGLRNKRNYFRWVEYALSSTLMIDFDLFVKCGLGYRRVNCDCRCQHLDDSFWVVTREV